MTEAERERLAIRDYLNTCAAEADRQRLNMQAAGHKLEARAWAAERRAYANAAAMIEREDHASYRRALLTNGADEPKCLNCGTTGSLEQVRERHPGALSCCPERKDAPRGQAD